MSYAFHWRKAMAVSFFLHMILLVTAGYIASGFTAKLPIQEEVILEMDLMSDPADRAGNSPSLPDPQHFPDVPKPIPTQTTPLEQIKTSTPVVNSEAVVTTSDLTMTEAEAPSSSASSSSSEASSSSSSAAPAAVSGGGSRGGIAAPGILSRVDPSYPAEARQAGLEGTAELRVQILANGRPGEISVSKSTGHSSLDDAAVAAVAKWRFIPAKDRDSGKTVSCYTSLPVSFRLR
ncbi:energy transducer TonB [Pelosinus propionicus]|uniref:Outer membrane transport energization protein TonB n=1 Tax=Pelosinus propionicus DSM 13327 TaxID=1123291 RepID=A0A1I4N8I8_9FIRM|nr:energy transducer TonB [Pelosinus propionicus]SFM11798.1 outer membrane transport energization protein TonB [Pelosinus propionicus DSM 13327]